MSTCVLKGYDRAEAVALILGRMDPEDYRALPWAAMPALLAQCIDADFAFMLARGIMRRDGTDGDFFYNKRAARLAIIDTLLARNRFTPEQKQEIPPLVDDYMDYNRSYLQLNGLKYHEDERLTHERMGW